MVDQHNVSLTLSGADQVRVMIDELGERCRLVGSVEEVERRIGREVGDTFVRDLFAIGQRGADLWIEATPEFHRVMSALDG